MLEFGLKLGIYFCANPYSGWPWRVAFFASRGGGQLVVTVRHEVADVAGALTATRELASRLMGSSHVDSGPRDRGFGQVLRAVRLRQIPAVLLGLLNDLCLPVVWPALGRIFSGGDGARNTGPPTWRTVALDAAEGSPFRNRCRAAGATMNDGLVAVMLRCASRLTSRGRLGCFFTADLRRFLPDQRPLVANLSSGEVVHVPRRAVPTLDAALQSVVPLTARAKRIQAGLSFFLVNCSWALFLPGAAVRRAARLFSWWASTLLRRTLAVTNVGPLDAYLEPFCGEALAATVIGPALSLTPVPLVTASTFRDRLTLEVNGFADDAGLLDRMTRELRTSLEEWAPDDVSK